MKMLNKTTTGYSVQDSNSDPLELIIGLDFGTATTKVVVQAPFEPDSPAFVVPFGEFSHVSSQHLVPTALWISEDSKLVSLRRSSHATLLTDFKYAMMKLDRPAPRGMVGWAAGQEFPAASAVITYIAIVLKYVRKWFLTEQVDKFKARPIEWSVNVGLPSENFEDQSLCSRYLSMCRLAWQYSLSDTPITFGDFEDKSKEPAAEQVTGEVPKVEWTSGNSDSNVVIALIPELVAEVRGYSNSSLRRDGLHFLIDIGASTLDICSFILHENDGEDQYEILSALVEPLGTSRLHERRMSCITAEDGFFELLKALSIHMQYYEPANPLPDTSEGYLPATTDLNAEIEHTRTRIIEADCRHKQRCRQSIASIVDYTRTSRDPRSTRWKDSVPLFVAGGGRELGLYKDAIFEFSKWMEDHLPPCMGFQSVNVDRPQQLVGEFDPSFFARVSVAWGLSFAFDDIGAVHRPGEIEDIQPREKHVYKNQAVTKDQI